MDDVRDCGSQGFPHVQIFICELDRGMSIQDGRRSGLTSRLDAPSNPMSLHDDGAKDTCGKSPSFSVPAFESRTNIETPSAIYSMGSQFPTSNCRFPAGLVGSPITKKAWGFRLHYFCCSRREREAPAQSCYLACSCQRLERRRVCWGGESGPSMGSETGLWVQDQGPCV